MASINTDKWLKQKSHKYHAKGTKRAEKSAKIVERTADGAKARRVYDRPQEEVR